MQTPAIAAVIPAFEAESTWLLRSSVKVAVIAEPDLGGRIGLIVGARHPPASVI